MVRRRILMWSIAAVSASALLAGVLVWQQKYAQSHGPALMPGDPHIGSRLFFEKEGCAHCHAVNGMGGRLAPDLGYSTPRSRSNRLYSAMWNHAPRMWQQMQSEKLSYPDLSEQEMAHLSAFLDAARSSHERGDKINSQ